MNAPSIHDRFNTLVTQALEAPSGEEILTTCLDLAALLLRKNTQYGDSALSPRRTFSKAPPDEQIKVRIDDKLNRLEKGAAWLETEDIEQDLLGYLVLLRIARTRQTAAYKCRNELDAKTEFAEAGDVRDPLFSKITMKEPLDKLVLESTIPDLSPADEAASRGSMRLVDVDEEEVPVKEGPTNGAS